MDDLDEINVCIGYENSEGEEVSFPSDSDGLNEITPKYETVAGWNCSTEGIQSVEHLPENARQYVSFLESLLGIPITIISQDLIELIRSSSIILLKLKIRAFMTI